MLTHAPTCEIYRGGDHGPCDCGYERERLAMAPAHLALVERARRLYPATTGCVPLPWEMADAIESLSRQRAALRSHVEGQVRHCPGCRGHGTIPLPCLRCLTTSGEHEHVRETVTCERCRELRAALEVR